VLLFVEMLPGSTVVVIEKVVYLLSELPLLEECVILSENLVELLLGGVVSTDEGT
jgi:hypothetical protein